MFYSIFFFSPFKAKHLPELVVLPNAIVLFANRISSLKYPPAIHYFCWTVGFQVHEVVLESKTPLIPVSVYVNFSDCSNTKEKRDEKEIEKKRDKQISDS